MFSPEKAHEDITNLRSRIWKSKIFLYNQVPDYFLTSLYSIFLIQNILLTLESSLHLKISPTNPTGNLLFSVTQFAIGAYDLTFERNENMYTALGIFFCLYGLLMLVLILAILIYTFTGRAIHHFVRDLFAYIRNVHIFVLAVPINNYLLKIGFSFLEGELSVLDLPLVIGTGLIIIFSLGLIFLGLLCEFSLIKTSILSRSNNNWFFACFLHAFINGIYFGKTMSQTTLVEFNQNWLIVDFILNLTQIGVLITFVPFINSLITNLTIFTCSLKLALSLANLLVSALLTEKGYIFESIIFLTLISFIILLKLTYILLDDKHPASVLDQRTLFIKNDFWLIRRIHNYLQLIQSSDHKLDQLKHSYSIDNLMVYSNQNTLASEDIPNVMSDDFCKKLLQLADIHLTNSELKMGIIKVLIDAKRNFFQNYGLIQKQIISERDPIKAVGFMMLKAQIEEANFKSHSDSVESQLMKKYLDGIIYQQELTKMVEKFSVNQSKLYKLLQMPNAELFEIANLVSGLIKSQSQIHEYWNQIPQAYNNLNPELMKIYSGFIKPFDEDLYKSLMTNYKFIRARLMSKDHKNYDCKFEISPKTMYMLTSLEQKDFGKILLCSQNMSHVLKYVSQNLAGKNLRTLLPFALQQSLEKKIQKRVDDNKSSGGIEGEKTYLMTLDGFLRPLTEFSSIISLENKGLCQWSIFELDKDCCDYLIADSFGYIEAYTKAFYRDFQLDKMNRVTLKSLCEKSALKFDEIVRKATKKNSFKLKIPNSMNWLYQCEVQDTDNKNFFFIRSEKIKMTSADYNEFDSDDDMSDVIPLEYTNPDIRVSAEISPVIGKITSETQNQTNPTQIDYILPFKREISMVPTAQALSKMLDDEDQDDEKSKDSSLVYSVRQSSVNSSQSYLDHKRVELKETLDSLKFFKFSEKYIPIIAALIFVGIYLFVIMYSYITSTNLIDQVNKRVYIFNQVSARARFILEMCRNAHANVLYQDFWPDGKSKQVTNYNQMLARIKGLANYNSLLRTALGNVDDNEMVERFFEKNVKVFYDDFEHISTTDKYTYENSFTATNLLISQADVLLQIAFKKDSFQMYVMHYMMTNAFNDLTQENEDLFDYLISNIFTRLDKIVAEEQDFLIVTIVLLVCCVISTQLILYISFQKTSLYLTAFVDPSTKCLDNFMMDNSNLTLKEQAKTKEKTKGKKSESKSYKNPHKKRLFNAFMFKMIYILIFLAIPLGLLLKNHTTTLDTSERIKTTMNDVYSFNKIRIHAIYTINLQITVIVYPQGFSLYTKNSENFLNQIVKMDRIISTEEGFSTEALKYLHDDFCPYYLFHPLRPVCGDMSQGVAHRGITPTMLSIQTYFTSLDTAIRKANGNLTELAVYMLGVEFLDNFFIISNGINPAIEHYQTEMTDHLISDLTDISQVIISLFIAGAVVGVAIMVVILYTIWVLVGGDRKKIVQLVRLVPQEYLIKNRDVKVYLIRQSDEATRYLKSIEKKMMQNE